MMEDGKYKVYHEGEFLGYGEIEEQTYGRTFAASDNVKLVAKRFSNKVQEISYTFKVTPKEIEDLYAKVGVFMKKIERIIAQNRKSLLRVNRRLTKQNRNKNGKRR